MIRKRGIYEKNYREKILQKSSGLFVCTADQHHLSGESLEFCGLRKENRTNGSTGGEGRIFRNSGDMRKR